MIVDDVSSFFLFLSHSEQKSSVIDVEALSHFEGVTNGCCVLVAESAVSFRWEPFEGWFLDLVDGPLGRQCINGFVKKNVEEDWSQVVALVNANCVGDCHFSFTDGEGEFEIKVHSSYDIDEVCCVTVVRSPVEARRVLLGVMLTVAPCESHAKRWLKAVQV